MEFNEDDETIDLYIKNEIDVFLLKKRITAIELKYYKEDLGELSYLLNVNYGLSSRKIANYIGMSRETIRTCLDRYKLERVKEKEINN